MRLLVTRPEEDAGRLAEALRALGHQPVLLPLLEIVFPQRPPLNLSGVQALIATSRNALRGLSGNAAFAAARRLPLYAVGGATAELGEELGFAPIRTGAGTARDLVPLIAETARPESGALLYLTGEHIAFDLAEMLTALRFTIRREIVYTAQEAEDAAPALAAHIRAGLDGIVLMSPRTAQSFAALLSAADTAGASGLTCYCYSSAVAKPLENFAGLRLCVASRPAEADLLSLIGGSVPA